MPKQPPRKNEMTRGLEFLLNHPKTSPFKGNGMAAFRTVLTASEMPVTEALKHVGKQSKAPKKKDADISKDRLEELEKTTEENTG
jgi:hypothetical protein